MGFHANRQLGLCLSKLSGCWIFNMSNNLSAYYAHEGERGTKESA